MGKIVERKKKKGRPSLLDLQKRRIKEQAELEHQLQPHHQKPNPNPSTPLTSRRSTRRKPLPDPSDYDDEDDDEEQSVRTRRQRKKVGRSSVRRGNSDSDGEEEVDEEEEEEEDVGRILKKRKINAIADGSGSAEIRKVEKIASVGIISNTHQGTVADDGNRTPLPDKKLLAFILDRLQKKDTYGVFSEPVDPEELPDYHEVIEHPMDFSTVRKNLDGGAYSNLEEFESDVFLICSNAMQYNAPDTVYFKQARSIQELAEKSFDNLRRDSDDDDDEQEPKRRGRPPSKHSKKPPGRPPLDLAGSENASGATLATGRESTAWSNYDLRKGSPVEKAGPRDSVGRSHLNPGNSEAYNNGWLSQQKLDRNDDYSGSQLRGGSYKQGKKPVAFNENRRDTYKQLHPSAAINSSSVFSTFDVEKKMLLPVGLHAEYGYARSLARFAAALGPAAWNIASKKIVKAVPPEIKFGPGWVGHDDVSTQRTVLINPCSSDQVAASDQLSPPSVSAHNTLKIRGDKSTSQLEGDKSLGYELASTVAALDCQPAAAAAISIPSSAVRSLDGAAQSSKDGVLHETRAHLPQNSISATGQRSPFQFQQQGAAMHLGMNGVNLQPQLSQLNMQQIKMNQLNVQPQMSQHNLQSQINQHAGPQLRIPTGFNHNYPQMAKMVPRSSADVTNPMPGNYSASDGTNLFLTNRSTANIASSSNPASDTMLGASRMRFHPEPTSASLAQQQKQVSVPPDLNIQFQSPGSPSPSSSRLDSKHPDLALQL
uniref:Bromo domain-containing protein n=1 Tax=Kalanchoe fedtschenkoi TaxID=63787 RepID=A0A7N0UNC0_KALFE